MQPFKKIETKGDTHWIVQSYIDHDWRTTARYFDKEVAMSFVRCNEMYQKMRVIEVQNEQITTRIESLIYETD